MHVRVTRGQFDGAKYDEVAQLTKDVGDALQSRPGFRGYQGAHNRDTGALIAISTWDTEDAANFQREALGDVVPRLLSLGTRLDPPEIYEVAVTL